MTTQDKEHNEVINDQYHKYSYEEPKNVTSPNDLYHLTPFGINKVLNKELPVVLQVIDIMEKTLTAREKVTLMEPDTLRILLKHYLKLETNTFIILTFKFS